VEINPTIPQDKFIFSGAKYPAMVAGFGAGKTEALIVRSILGKLQCPTTDRAFYEPTYDLIRMIAWPRYEEMLSGLNIPYRLVKHPHNILDIEGCGRIIFRSMDTPSRIIGYEVGDSDVDELDTLKRDDAAEVWRRILSRNRQKKPDGSPNTAAVATTPEGFRFVYETWEVQKIPGYEIIRAPTYSNPHLPADYVQSLRDIYPENLLNAYLEGLFVNLTSGTIYIGFSRDSHNTNEVESAGEPLFIGMDFNVGNMSAVIHVKREGKPVAVAEITKAYDTPDICSVIKERYSGHAIHIFPDASGDSRKSVNASKTDIQILRDSGFSVHAPKRNPPVRDRINAMNAAFGSGYLVNVSRCPSYARCLEQQVYGNNGEPDKSQGLDHLPDSGGYFIHHDYPIIKPVTSIKMGFAT
tara:strand:- start:28644 stop:29876 length:1233 start_codon:yes stop_codon:yes gene_type:complete